MRLTRVPLDSTSQCIFKRQRSPAKRNSIRLDDAFSAEPWRHSIWVAWCTADNEVRSDDLFAFIDAVTQQYSNGTVWVTSGASTGDMDGWLISAPISQNSTAKPCVARIFSPNDTAPVRGLGSVALCGSAAIVAVQTQVLAYSINDCNVIEWSYDLPLDDPATPVGINDGDSRHAPAAVCDSQSSIVYVQTRHSVYAFDVLTGTYLWSTLIAQQSLKVCAFAACVTACVCV
jgi:outer membrane protein assembly factor BamB